VALVLARAHPHDDEDDHLDAAGSSDHHSAFVP